MKKSTAAIVGMALGGSAVCNTALADGFYIGGAYWDLEAVSYDGGIVATERPDQDLTGFKAQLGWQFGDNFAIEGMYGQTEDNIGDDDDGINGLGTGKLETDIWGVYMRAFTEVAPHVGIQGILGYTDVRAKQDTDNGQVNFKDSDADFSYGVGLLVRIIDGVELSADWTQYLGDTSALGDRLHGLSYGIRINFGKLLGGDDD